MDPGGAGRSAPRSEDLEMLRRGLLGQRQKVIAIDLNKSHSTVTSRMGGCLGCMGFAPLATRAPALLVAAAVASTSRARLASARLTPLEDGAMQLVSIPRLDRLCVPRLTAAERHVVRCIVDGMMHREVSKHRTTATRTVANQLASAFRKLGVSGRSELLAFLATESAPGKRSAPA
ncbi:MAG: helix-turn-helix transcriptional regulator [Pseudomonadota bacterium]